MATPQPLPAIALGGTLFVPASHKDLDTILSGKKYHDLRSVVIDFEDGLPAADRPEAMKRLGNILAGLKKSRLLRFIRPQDPQMLKTLLRLDNIAKIDGFIFPKFGLENADSYLSLISNDESRTMKNFMPSIEGEELFDTQKLQKLRDILLPYHDRIICIRFGAEDMLRQLGLRRGSGKSLYDMLVPSQVIAGILATFKPHGFDISAPVFPDFSDKEGFKKEIRKELENGFVSKTIIHPGQIAPMNELYNVTEDELCEAKALLSKKEGVMNLGGRMGETKTQSPWAAQILKRAELFNVV